MNDLIEYVTNQHLTPESKNRIRQLCEVQPPVSMTVYRGHGRTPIIKPSSWFSTTTSKEIAKTEFATKNGIVFTIHLINVPAIDINHFIKDKIKNYSDENEWIVLGGGTFYKDDQLSEVGFFEINLHEYECWYTFEPTPTHTETPKQTTKLTNWKDFVRKNIPEDEFELIRNTSDIYLPNKNLTETDKTHILNAIRELQKGGLRNSRLSRAQKNAFEYMPFKILKNKNGTYRVINRITGKIYAHSTTKKRAKKQIRMLGMIESRRKTQRH